MSVRLDGRAALVTGAARGIGAAIARELHALGAAVVLVDNGVDIAGREPNTQPVEALAAEFGARGVALSADIAAPGAAEAAVAETQARFGGLDIVVTAHAILRDAFIFKATRADWEEVLRVNLGGCFACCAAAAPIMRDQVKLGRDPGAIVNLVSSAGFYGNYGQAAYAASKAGIFGLTRAAAFDLARSGVRCNAVAPFAATRVTESIQAANPEQAAYKANALRVPAAPVARLVAYLASTQAAAINGQLFACRGREVFLFNQARPTTRVAVSNDTYPELDRAIATELAPRFTDLRTDLEAFSDPALI
jgi:NAD(P)-dependent dehydrogenase (short-subunit alcohol dehydrogenase family)